MARMHKGDGDPMATARSLQSILVLLLDQSLGLSALSRQHTSIYDAF